MNTVPDEVIVQLERELRLMEADYQCTLQAEPSRTAINRSSHSVFHPILCQIALYDAYYPLCLCVTHTGSQPGRFLLKIMIDNCHDKFYHLYLAARRDG